MSHASISTCFITCSYFYGIKARATFYCSIILSIGFCKSNSIVARSVVEVSPTSTFAYTCSSLILHGANAPSSTLTCTCFCIFHPSKPLSLMTTPMPSANLVKACSSSLVVLAFFQIYIYQSCKNHQKKKKKNFLTNTRIQIKHPHQFLLLPNTVFWR